MSFGTILDYTYNRNQGVKLTILSMGFLTGDKKGHTFRISIVDKKGDVDLSGASVTGWFIPNDQGLIDDLSVPLKGSVDGNKAILSLPAEAYLEVGRFNLVIKLNFDGDVSTIFWGAGNVSRSNTDSQIDVGNVIPSLEDLLAQIERIESATATAKQAALEANESATKANASALKADESSATANASADRANASALNANSSVENVNAAVLKIDGMTVSAEKADKADAVISEVDGAKHIAFKLPKGDTGATPSITFEVETGAAGTNVLIDQRGTAENPVVKLTIPRGDTGAVDGVDYYEGAPNALGTASPGKANGLSRGDHVHPMPNANDVGARPNDWMPNANDVGARPNDWMPNANDVGARPDTWMPSAEDVGALPKDGTAKNAQRLEGRAAKYYEAQDNLLDNGNFSNPINQRRQGVYSGAEQYTIDRWRSTSTLSVTIGEEKITLACAQDALAMGGFRQYIAPERKIQDGDVLTLACMSADGTMHIGTATASGTGTVDVFGDHESTFTGQINVQEGYAQFLVPIGGSIDLVWALLIKGEYSAEDIAFKPRRYIDEYLECARYYQYVYMRRPVGSFNSTSVMLINVPMIVPMRRNDPAVNTLVTPTGIRLAGDSHEITRYTMSMSNYNPKEGNCALVSMEFSPALEKTSDSHNAGYLVNTLSLGLSCDLPDSSLDEGDEE